MHRLAAHLTARRAWLLLVAVFALCLPVSRMAAQSPSPTPHPIPTTPPGAVATRPPGPWVDAPPPPAGCQAETEPNDRPEGAITLSGEFCVTGTLAHERDQDLYFYEVAPEDGLVTWDVTVRGVPTTYTSIHYLPLKSPVGVTPIEVDVGGEVGRVDSDVWAGTPPGTGQIRLWPGAYLLGISRGLPGYKQDLTDDLGYWVQVRRGGTLAPAGDVEPNDTADTATPITGAFALSGDLEGSVDVYRWTIGAQDAAQPWLLTARSSLHAPLTLELIGPDGVDIGYARAGPEGEVTFHDLGLAPGEYLVKLPNATGPQPYELTAEPVTDADIDREPDDTPEQALPVDPSTGTVSGRLTSDTDVDMYLVDVDTALAAGLVDVDMAWSDGTTRSLCIATESGTRLGCDDGIDGVAFRGMLIPEGRYLLTVSGEGGLDDRYRVTVSASDVAQPAREIEPNDDPSSAMPLAGAFAVGGDLIGGPDTFAWTLDPAAAAQAYDLDVSGAPGLGATVDLLLPDGTRLARASLGYTGTARIWDLRLPPATYTIAVTSTGNEPTRYVLRGTPETTPDIDAEPNDYLNQAVPLDPVGLMAHGRLPTRTDIDFYSFVLDEAHAATLTEITLTWEGRTNRQLCVASQYGSVLECAAGREGVRLSSLELAAGTWTLQVSGDGDPDSTYEVRVVAGAPATPDGETEPNDNDGSADTWDTADVMHGTSRYGDVDEYRVHIPEGQPMIWRLDIAGGHLSAPEWRQPDGTHVGSVHVSDDVTSVTIDDLYLVSGDHLLTVRGGDDYTLTLTLIGPPDLTAEREPNDDADHARLLPMAAERTGRLPVGGDVDVFRFSLSAPEHVVISADPSASGGDGIQLADATLELEITSAKTSLVKVPAPAAGGPTVFDGLLPQADYEVWVRPAPSESGLPPTGDIVYSIDLERADPFVDPAASPSAPLPAELTLTTTTPEVAAYWRDGQRVEATLHIAPGAGDGLDLDLEATTSHHAWRVEIPAHVTVPSDGLDVPLTIHVPSDAWRDIPVRITVRATDAGGAQASAWTEIVPRQDPAPVSEEAYWPIPDALLGGLDAASLAVGGRSPTGNYREDQAHDDLVIAGTGYSQYFPNGPVTTTVDLAGDDPVPVAGTIIDPLGGAGTFGGRPRAFQLLLSLDGETYTSVLSGELGPQALEQAFVLPEPVDARFARLEVDTSWGGTSGPVDIGEWKVVAPPGWAPSPDGFDLADPVRGGHISASEPEYRTANDMLSATDTNVRTVLINAGASQRIAIGFADDRAAQITGLRWQDPPGSDPAVRIPSVGVEVTEDSPLGPWRDVGTWQLVRAADGSVAPFDLPEPTWARFVRLTLPGATDADKYWDLPSKLSILERPTDDVYRSILGQWGQSSPRGIHEVLVPPPVDTSAEDVDVPDTADAAAPLAAGDVANGRVARSVDTDWYQLTVPADQNTLTIRLDTERAGDVVPRLIDASGADVPLTTSGTAGGVTATTIVEPGASYRLELVQPILSVVFTFDTSSSIKPWYPLVRAAIGTFATGVRPGLEAVQVFPFEEHDLLQGFSDQAYLIQSAIDAWTTEGGSSFLQASIERAAATLLERNGARAVLAIGDAVGGGFQGGLPVGKIELSNPAIFPVHVGATDDPAVSTHIMQDLAVANGGYYQYATSLAEMERAFDRMATWMRRPAAYALSYQTSLVDYPPGSIGVAPAEGAQVRIGGVAVELVLDTSTSMNIRIGAQTRMAVAKKSLSSLVQTALPEGLPVALRIFKPGSNGKQSCDSTLAVPIGPLDRAAMLDRIKRLKIGKGTRTPLAATIEAVKDDIGNVKGPRIVVVVTDGNESCKGDPQAAVKALVEAGFDTTVNIVGLALEDERLKDKMASWAATGGGVFLDAQDQAGLSAAIAQTLRAPFRVIDDTGAVVGEGIVGDAAVSVPIGTYRVEVLSEPPVTFEDVQIGPNQAVIFTVGDE